MEPISLAVPVLKILSYIKNPRKIFNEWRYQRSLKFIEKNVVFEKNACWRKELDGSKSGPYCSSCWYTKSILNPMLDCGTPGLYKCHTCNLVVEVEKFYSPPEYSDDNNYFTY